MNFNSDFVLQDEFSSVKTTKNISHIATYTMRLINVFKKGFLTLEVLLFCVYHLLSSYYFVLIQSYNDEKKSMSLVAEFNCYFSPILNFLDKIELVKEYSDDVNIRLSQDLIRINFSESLDTVELVKQYRNIYVEKNLLISPDEMVDDFGSLNDLKAHIEYFNKGILDFLQDFSYTEEDKKFALIINLRLIADPIKKYFKIKNEKNDV